MMVLNTFRAPTVAIPYDIAMIEGVAGLNRAGVERACFGSYAPFFILESAVGKLQESAVDIAVLDTNASKLLGRR